MASSQVKKVSVIILTYNGKRLLEQFLSSVKKLDYSNYEVIILDNGSTDGSVDFVKNHFPEFTIFKNETNVGFSKGCNIGAQHASGDYLLFLANDMEVDSNLIKEMVKMVESDPAIGVCASKTLKLGVNNRRTKIIDNVGGELDILGFGIPRGANEVDKTQWDFETTVFFAYGCPSLIKHEVFDKVGGFDPEYFALYEDVDLCWRVKLTGYKIAVNPSAISYHKGSATVRSIFDRGGIRFLAEKNILRTLLKNYSTSTLIRILPQYIAILSGEMVFYLAIRRVDMALALVKSVIWNITHIKSALYLRVRIQKIRVASDDVIQKEMIKKSLKITILRQWFMGRFII